MAACEDCFREFLHPLVHQLMDKNKQFKDRYGTHARWDWDDVDVTLTFTDPISPALRIDVTVVGSTEGDSWEWSWANSNYAARSKRDMDSVREFGEANGYERLTSAFLEADDYTGWEMTAVAAHVLDALGAYRFPTDNGYCYLIYRKIEESKTEKNIDLSGEVCGTVALIPSADLTENTG
jgi:hypothetical protein